VRILAGAGEAAELGTGRVVTERGDSYDKRLGKVETELARQGERMDRVERDVSKIGSGVEELLRRDIARPQPPNWRAAIATGISILGGLAMLAAFSWWFTSVSPAVLNLERRTHELDDARIGRVSTTEKRLEQVEKRLQRYEDWRPVK
jgi:hypothetical protein